MPLTLKPELRDMSLKNEARTIYIYIYIYMQANSCSMLFDHHQILRENIINL
jgi:hypothetical protein